MSDEDRDTTILKLIQNLNPICKDGSKRSSERSRSDEIEQSSKRAKFERSNEVNLDDSESCVEQQECRVSNEFNINVVPKVRPSLDMTFTASPKESRRLRSDLIEARNMIMNLENRIKHMHGLRKEMQMVFENETKGLTRQRKHDIKTIEELEKQLIRIRKRESELKEELSELKNEFKDYKLDMEININELESNISSLMEKLEDSDSMENTEIAELKRKVIDLEVIYEAAQKDVESHKQLVFELEKELNEKKAQERDCDIKDQALQRAQSKVKELEVMKDTYMEWQQQAKSQQYKIEMYKELEKENIKLKEETKNLKEEVRNKLLLEEQVHDLTERLRNYKDIDKKLTNMQMAHNQNEMYLEEWRTVARCVCETTTNDSTLPRLLRGQIERLQQQEVTLTSAKVELESQLNTVTLEAKMATTELKKTQKHIADVQRTQQQTQSLIHRMQKKMLLVSRERDSYRQQLDSYEKDLTMSVVPGGSTVQFQSQRERIEALEKIVEGYREMIEKMENDSNIAQPFTSGDIPVPIRSEQIHRMQEQIDQLQAENERLMQRKDQLEIQLEEQLVGEDMAVDRVIHFAKNPFSECVEQNEGALEKLREENERLRKKIRMLEEGLEASKLGDSSVCSRELETLRDQKDKAEKKMLKLKDVFKNSLQEFRDVIYMLFGYKVDKLPSSVFKLTSMYAENEEDNLCFIMNQHGQLGVCETDFLATIEDKKQLHLHHQKSIPVFLSAITMDLFCNRTNVV